MKRREHYEVALLLPASWRIPAAARTEYYLGIAAMQQQDTERAFAHYQAAIVDYQQTGNRVQEIMCAATLPLLISLPATMQPRLRKQSRRLRFVSG
ncbi:MAG: hypothetical protein R2867_06710 [Caldilineaceae bacterium]